MAGEILELKAAVEAAFPGIRSSGTYNRRYIAGTSIWSQHAYDPNYGNAWDIRPPAGDSVQEVKGSKSNPQTTNTLDDVYRWLVNEKRRGTTFDGKTIGTILWRVDAHYDHIHVELSPKFRGTPPPTKGYTPSTEEEEVEELTKYIQQALVDGGYPLPQYGVDGKWGSETQSALTQAFEDAKAGQTGNHYHKVTLRGQTGDPV